jgi:ammonia channel protein AmtB
MNEKENIFLIVSALLVLLILISLIVLFTVFQKKKNALVEE